MTEPDSEMAPGADGKVPGTSATLVDLGPGQAVLPWLMDCRAGQLGQPEPLGQP